MTIPWKETAPTQKGAMTSPRHGAGLLWRPHAVRNLVMSEAAGMMLGRSPLLPHRHVAKRLGNQSSGDESLHLSIHSRLHQTTQLPLSLWFLLYGDASTEPPGKQLQVLLYFVLPHVNSAAEIWVKGAGYNLWKNDIAIGHDKDWLEPTGSKMAEDLTSSRPWASFYTHLICWHMLSDMPTGAVTVLKLIIKGQKVGSGPISGNPGSFSKIIRIILSFISLWNYPARRN